MYDLNKTAARVSPYVGLSIKLPSGGTTKLKLSSRMMRDINRSETGLYYYEEKWPLWSEDGKFVFSEDLRKYGVESEQNGIFDFFELKEPLTTLPKDPEKLAQGFDLYRSGFVCRYHCHPNPNLRNAQDLTDAHSNRMVKLFYLIFPEYAQHSNVVAYIIMHDAGEFVSGDSPYSAKRDSPALKAALDDVEGAALAGFYGLFQTAALVPVISQKEERMVKILDRLESFLFQTIHAPGYQNSNSALYQGILTDCHEFGKEGIVRDLMDFALANSQQGE